MEKANPVLATARADYAEALVAIDEKAIAALELFEPGGELQSIGSTLPLSSLARAMEGIPYFIAMNALNFQFWDVTDSGELVRYRHKELEGALAMQAAFLNAWEAAARLALEKTGAANNVPVIARALNYHVTSEGLTRVFGDIPEIGKRARILMEVLEDGNLLQQVAANLLDAVHQGELAWTHAELLAKTYPGAYGDAYLKKAQLTMMFIAGQWNAHTPPNRACRLNVTAAADYQLPKILRALGVLRYSVEVADTVDRQQLIPAGSVAERAIRAATVLACEKLAAHLQCTVPEVDFWLWVNRNQARGAQFHLTRTTAY
ncbi:queuosine salvage family protein [Burkholderia ubonensis]|nr:queuosine salvage family protein [Burkholderia ubonensis]